MALNEEQITKIRLTLQSSGWNDVIRPALQTRAQAGIKALCLTRTERAKSYPGSDFDTDDEVLRAIIRDCEWMLAVWPNEIAVFEHNRRLDELDREGQNPTGAAANQ